jgi:hypothetical protein
MWLVLNLITSVHTDALIPTVTTPSEIIPYYRLNHSIWLVSDNKESSRWVLSGLHQVNHLKTQRGSNVCIKTPTKESPECLTNQHQIPHRVHYYNIVSWHEWWGHDTHAYDHDWCMEWSRRSPTRVSKSTRRSKVDPVWVPEVEAKSNSSSSPVRSPGAVRNKTDARSHTESVLDVLYMVGSRIS